MTLTSVSERPMTLSTAPSSSRRSPTDHGRRPHAPGTFVPEASPAYRRMWNTNQRKLAVRLLETASDPAGIRRAQRDVLVPLELRLVARSRDELLTFWQVVDAAREALDHHELNR